MKRITKWLGKIAVIAFTSCVITLALLSVDRQCAIMYGIEGSMSDRLVEIFHFIIENKLNFK